MIKLSIKTSKGDYEGIYIKIKEIKAIKVVNGETKVFLKDKGFVCGTMITVKETPEEIGKIFVDTMIENGKEIGINGCL